MKVSKWSKLQILWWLAIADSASQTNFANVTQYMKNSLLILNAVSSLLQVKIEIVLNLNVEFESIKLFQSNLFSFIFLIVLLHEILS